MGKEWPSCQPRTGLLGDGGMGFKAPVPKLMPRNQMDSGVVQSLAICTDLMDVPGSHRLGNEGSEDSGNRVGMNALSLGPCHSVIPSSCSGQASYPSFCSTA